MIVYNYRMLEQARVPYYGLPSQTEFPFFNPFQQFYRSADEFIMPPSSPNGSQSDSDNSVSSVDVTPKIIRKQHPITKGATIDRDAEIQCRWMSCGIVFESLDQLATHVSRVHASSRPGGLFYCGWEGCTRNNKGFNARYKMLVHVRTHTNEKPHQCCQCDKSFSRAENLKIHSRSHSGEKPYVCPMPGCLKAYSNSSDRFKHTRTHQVEKPYQCKIPGCLKRYTDPSSLRKHVKTYKHFVDRESRERVENTTSVIVNNQLSRAVKEECIFNDADKTEELLKLGKYIDLKSEKIDAPSNWNSPFPIYEPKLFKPYEIESAQQMIDVDLPLDLRVNKK